MALPLPTTSAIRSTIAGPCVNTTWSRSCWSQGSSQSFSKAQRIASRAPRSQGLFHLTYGLFGCILVFLVGVCLWSVRRCGWEAESCQKQPKNEPNFTKYDSKWAPEWAQNGSWDPCWPQSGQSRSQDPLRSERGVTFRAKMATRRGSFWGKSQTKNHVDFESRKSRSPGGPRFAKWTLWTSKINQNHWRGSRFQLFTLFRRKSLFGWFSRSRGSFWDDFGSQIWNKNRTKKLAETGRAKRHSEGPITISGSRLSGPFWPWGGAFRHDLSVLIYYKNETRWSNTPWARGPANFIILCVTVLYFTWLYFMLLYCTLFCFAILYFTIFYFTFFYFILLRFNWNLNLNLTLCSVTLLYFNLLCATLLYFTLL